MLPAGLNLPVSIVFGQSWRLVNMKKAPVSLTAFCLLAALTAGAQSTTQHLPERTLRKLRTHWAGPHFIADDATILDWPAKKGGEFRVLRKGSSEWTCLQGPPPGATHDEPGFFDKAFFQWATDGLAGRPQHIDRLGVCLA
jgi:hypothetical protein